MLAALSRPRHLWLASRAAFAELLALPRWVRLLAAFLFILACALAFPRGGAAATVVTFICVATVMAAALAIADPEDRRWVFVWTLLAITGREALVGAIDVVLLRRGALYYAPDETVYISHGYDIWQYWMDPSVNLDSSDGYYGMWYIHAIARLYALLGGENIVAVKLINTTLSVIAGVLGYRVMRNLGMAGARWALVLGLAFPSVAFWSALTLKDTYVIFFLILSLWMATEFVRGRSPIWLVAALLVLVPLQTVRLYMLVTGALALLAIPFALAGWRKRLASGAGLVVGVYVLFSIVRPFADLGPNVFWIPIEIRANVASGARSNFVEPKPAIRGQPGEEFVVAIPGVTASAAASPRIVEVQPSTPIVIEGSGSPPPTRVGDPTPAVVRAGDIVRIVTPSPSTAAAATTASPSVSPSASPSASPVGSTSPPAPTATLRVLTIEPDVKNTVGLDVRDPDETSVEGSLLTNLRQLPIGVTYTLLAPFPWTARTLEQFATIPEMLLWYLCLAAALVGFTVLLRRRDTRYAHGVAAIIGLTIVLSLISANTGTLIRSRAMLIPYVVLLSAVGVEWSFRRWPRVGDAVRRRMEAWIGDYSPS
jgi:hypothetical protein